MKVTVTARLRFMVTLQTFALEILSQPEVQVAVVEGASGLAVSITTVPAGKMEPQAVAQAMPGG